MARTKIPGTRREILEDARWSFATGELPSFHDEGKIRTFPDLTQLLRSYFGTEETAVGAVLEWLTVDSYAATLLEVGPWNPADVLRLHPFAFASPAIAGMVTNMIGVLRQGLQLSARVSREDSGEAQWPAPPPFSGFMEWVAREPSRTNVFFPELDASAEALRDALSRVAGALCAVPDGTATAIRAWKALNLRGEVRAVAAAECSGSVKAAYPLVARRRGFPSGDALRKEIHRALLGLREEAMRAERSNTVSQVVMMLLDEDEKADFAALLFKQRETWGTPPPVPHKPAGTAPGVPHKPLPLAQRTRKTSSGSTPNERGRHDELPNDNRSRRPAQGAAPNPQGLEAQREGAAILKAVRKPRAVRGRGAEPVPRGSDVRSHGRGDDSARKRPGRVKEPP